MLDLNVKNFSNLLNFVYLFHNERKYYGEVGNV